ncbi:MAG TPA: ATP-binding cassette domain-containing protein, partial [Acidimicrobiales bacterium]|nr:ATP-binding cassette domain-containing protein [Acidimicrobiales bacterium]
MATPEVVAAAPGGLAVTARQLTKRYGPVEAVRGIDLDVMSGETFGFLGPNGAGKSTTISMLCTLVNPTGGRATVAGFDVARQPQQVRQQIGLTGQFASVDEDLTGIQNLVMIGELLDLPRRAART